MNPADTQPATLVSLWDALRGRRCEEWPDRTAAAAAAGEVMRDALTDLGLWGKVAPAHRAAILAARVPFAVDHSGLTQLVHYTVQLVEAGGEPPPSRFPSDLGHQFDHAEEVLLRLEKLPEGWREEAVRAALEELSAAVHRMQVIRNRLASRGIVDDVAT